MTNEQREAIENLNEIVNLSKEELEKGNVNITAVLDYIDLESLETVLSLIKEQQNKIEKKDKQIDLMAEYINEIDVSEEICEGRTMCDEDCEKCIKQYFAGLVEKE